MKIALGCDHGGFQLMQEIKKHLEERGYEYEDFGTYTAERCDYPVFGALAAHAVADGKCDLGIVLCTTGIGISISANKVKGIRCALCSDSYSAEMARRHNDANMLAVGSGLVGRNLAFRIVDAFLDSRFESGRHAVRIGLIEDIESSKL